MADNKPHRERVQERAYQLWTDEGQPEGRQEEHWFKAEKELSPAGPGKDRNPDKKIGEVKYAEVNATPKVKR
jgi:hypothetical protein